MLGAAYDSTDLHDGQARTARCWSRCRRPSTRSTSDWRFTYVNAEAERLLGRPREELLGGCLWELFPATLGSDFEVELPRRARTGGRGDVRGLLPRAARRLVRAARLARRGPLSVYFLDITARRGLRRPSCSAPHDGPSWSPTSRPTCPTPGRRGRPSRGSRCCSCPSSPTSPRHLVDDQGDLRDVGWAHADPELQEVARRYSELRLAALKPTSYVASALRTGTMSLLTEDVTQRLAAVYHPGAARDLLLRLAPSAVAILPMQARGRTVGLLTIFNGPHARPFDDTELATARDVAARAALAQDNARLYAQQRELAEELQRSLLTPPPEPDHVEVVVRYAAAARAAQVGGDWYDAFLQPDGATMLVIGDVVGHDTAAAAAMGQVRGLLRGIAFTTEQGPAAVLTRLDAALEGLRVGTQATAVVARLEQSPEERRDGVTQLVWSNAGHPPPVALTVGGEVQLLGEDEEADLLLGFDPSSERTERRTTLARGSTVLLYTDGLVERRGQHLEEGLDRLRARSPSCRTCRSRSSATRCWSGCSPARATTTSRWSACACTARTSRGRPRPVRSACPRRSRPSRRGRRPDPPAPT
jgi:GAF domain-containing protein